ncbi:hypothetical protein MASR2M117_13350 [Paludibacter sp.]
MKKINLLLLIFSIVVLNNNAKADDSLYIYTMNSGYTSTLVDDVRSLTFGDESMTVHKNDGTTAVHDYNELRFFSLKHYDIHTTNLNVTTNNMFTISPNPVVDMLTVNVNKTLSTVSLFNLQGQKIFEEICNGNKIIIPMTNFSSGVYFISISDNEKINTTKLIKK